MYHCLVVRGATGVLVWTKVQTSTRVYAWVCSRDKFSVPMPTSPADAERVLLAIAQHSTTLVGAVAQVLDTDV